MEGMSAIVAIIVCTYLAGAFAAFGAANARGAGESSARTMVFVSCFSWLAFGYLACGGKLEPEQPASPAETIRLSGSTAADSSPWKV
jgi:hypothetical protein